LTDGVYLSHSIMTLH